MTEYFKKRAAEVHGDKYDYTDTVYLKAKSRVQIRCKVHGLFTQVAHNHLRGDDCKKCAQGRAAKKLADINLERKFKDLVQPTDYRLIPLSRGLLTMVDIEDFDRLRLINWHSTASGYAYNNKLGYLHRYILNAPASVLVDHINGNTIDNRRSNLRFATDGENSWNSKPKPSKSMYKGVYFLKNRKSKKWLSSIYRDGIAHRIGTFECEEEAARAYDKKAKELFGEFAYLNFPEF